MAHYSEMNFLFKNTENGSITDILNKTSNNNTFNIFKNPSNNKRPGYTVFKSKTQGVGTTGIKSYLKDTIYKTQSNPYIDILNEFNKTSGEEGAGLRLKPSDFAYLKDLGVYPINRLAILRRFPDGVFVPENLIEMKIEPISTIVGWIKPDQNFGTISFNETWSTTNDRFDVALAKIIKEVTTVDIASLVPVPDFAQGMLFQFYKNMGLLDSSGENGLEESYEYYDMNFVNNNTDNNTDTSANTWGLNHIPVGDPNVLQEGPFRDPVGQNIKSDFTFDLETTYEQKLLGDVDPGSAMLDILDNIYAMGTSNMVFYWGDDSSAIKKAKTAASGKGNNLYAWWEFVKEIATDFWKTLTGFFQNIVSDMKKKASELMSSGKDEDKKTQENSKEKEKEKILLEQNRERHKNSMEKYADKPNSPEYIKAKSGYEYNNNKLNEINGIGISSMPSEKTIEGEMKSKVAETTEKTLDGLKVLLNSILTSTVAIHRYKLRGSIELMTGGKDSSAPWHLTLGNPFSPWINTSHIIVKSATLEPSAELGFNDMPQKLTVKFTCVFSRSLGKQELMRMFNNSYRRTYSKPINKPIDQNQKTVNETIKNNQTVNETIKYSQDDTNQTTTPNTTVVSSEQETPGNNTINNNDPSIVNYLYNKGQDYSYGARKKMANEMGIKNYRGTAEQNTYMLNTLREKDNKK